MEPLAIILTGFGINCDRETATAFQRAGADARRVHLNDLIDSPDILESAHIFAVPGGFSFGDDIGSGRVLANRLRYKLGGPLHHFIADGKLIIGICNGFQVLTKMGALPMVGGEMTQQVTLTHNDSARFEDRWVCLETEPGTDSLWLEGIDRIELPARHGEGKFIPRDDALMEALEQGGQIVLRYANPEGGAAGGEYPTNPNGSIGDVAGITDPSGRVFGLMPHPEAFLDRTNHPQWTRRDMPAEGAGLQIFRNAVNHVRSHILETV